MTNSTTTQQQKRTVDFTKDYFRPNFDETKNPANIDEAISQFEERNTLGYMSSLLDKITTIAITSPSWNDLTNGSVDMLNTLESIKELKLLLWHLNSFNTAE